MMGHSHNTFQELSKDNGVLLIVDLFDQVGILRERATRLRPKTHHNSKTKEQVLLSRVMEVKEKMDKELSKMVNGGGSNKLLKEVDLSTAATSMPLDLLSVPQDPDYQRCPFCGLCGLDLVPENEGMERRNDNKMTIYT